MPVPARRVSPLFSTHPRLCNSRCCRKQKIRYKQDQYLWTGPSHWKFLNVVAKLRKIQNHDNGKMKNLLYILLYPSWFEMILSSWRKRPVSENIAWFERFLRPESRWLFCWAFYFSRIWNNFRVSGTTSVNLELLPWIWNRWSFQGSLLSQNMPETGYHF